VVRDNDAESWNSIQAWLLALRRRGVSVLLVHHAGKGGDQRGTSRREDVLDTSISLRRPGDYRAEDGARFEIHYEKARGVHGDDAKPFEAKLEVCNGAAMWTVRTLEHAGEARVRDMLQAGMTGSEIVTELGDEISRATVYRLMKKIREGGASNAELIQ
jgi:putative DNA primase/helicase